MGVPFRRDTDVLGSVGTTRYVTVPTSPATQIVLTSGYTAMVIYNLGTGSVVWGDSNIAVNSGAYIFPYAYGPYWRNVEDAFSVYVRADSVVAAVAVIEHGIP